MGKGQFKFWMHRRLGGAGNHLDTGLDRPPAQVRTFDGVRCSLLETAGDRGDLEGSAARWRERGRVVHIVKHSDEEYALYVN